MLLPADLLLVREAQRGPGRQEGVRHQPGRRLRLHAGDVPDLRPPRDARTARRPGRRRAACSAATATAVALLLYLGRRRQERPGPAVRLAPRRHGGPHPGVGPHPRRHHGHRRRVPPGPARTRSWSSARPPATSSPGSAPSPPWWPPPSPSSTSTSSGCWPTRRSASSATCSWPSGSAPTPPPSSTWSPTPSSRRSCSSAPARSCTAWRTSRTCGGWAACKKFMPITAMTFIVGWLAIAGIFPFAGFWSKDEILAAAWVSETVNGHQVLWAHRGPDGVPHRLLHDPPGAPRLLRRGAVAGPAPPRTRTSRRRS